MPSLLIAAATGYQLAVAIIRTSRLEAARTVDAIAAHQRLILQSAEQMLRTLAASNAVQTGNLAGMQAFFTRLVRANHQYAIVLATDPAGLVVASGITIDPYALSDRAYLAEALRRRTLVYGPFTISRATGLPVIPIALPVLGDEGEVRFVLIASLRVDVLKNALAGNPPPTGTVVEMIDKNGGRVYRYPADPAFPNGQPGDQELLAALALESTDYPFSVAYRGRRVFARSAAIAMEPSQEVAFRIRMAMPADTSNTPAILIPYVSFALLSIGLSVALAYWLYTRSIGLRLGAIAEVAAGISREHGASIRPPLDGEDELDLLRRTLVDSAETLRRRERERQEASALIEASLREKEALLKEIHHRVKNNFQVISSLLNLQAMTISDDRILKMFEESRNRIQSMALIHERLYRSDEFASIDFGDYARSMADQIEATYADIADRVSVRVSAGKSPLLLDAAVPLGLILNELLSNCFKHAFPAGRRGAVLVELAAGEGRRGVFSVRDDGIGLPADFDERRSGSLGLELVTTLAGQIKGQLRFESPPPGTTNGTRFSLSFPLPDGLDWTAAPNEAILDA